MFYFKKERQSEVAVSEKNNIKRYFKKKIKILKFVSLLPKGQAKSRFLMDWT